MVSLALRISSFFKPACAGGTGRIGTGARREGAGGTMPIAGCIVDIDNIAPGAIGKAIGGTIGRAIGGAIGGTISVELEPLTGQDGGGYNGYTGRETI